MTLPNCLMIGTAKSGTTTLKNLFNQHPEIGFLGEPNFFAKDSSFEKGLEQYRNKFKVHQSKKVIGEKSWRYSCNSVYPNAKKRIIDILGKDIKLIYVVRHPLERLQSLYLEFITGGLQDQVSLEFNESLRENPIFLDSSKYWTQLSFYLEDFDVSQLKVICFDDLKSSPDSVIQDLFHFLEVQPYDIDVEQAKANISYGKLAETPFTMFLRKYIRFNPRTVSLPHQWRTLGKKLLKSQVAERPSYNPETKAWLIEELQSEVDQILRFCNKPKNFWNLDNF